MIENSCLICNKKLCGKQKKFCSVSHQHLFWNRKNKEKVRIWSQNWREKKGLRATKDFPVFSCLVCDYAWRGTSSSRADYYPYKCPRCKSPSWDFGFNIKCSICLRNLFTPIIHHIDGNRKNNKKENRINICQNCHSAIHHREKENRRVCINSEVIFKLRELQNKIPSPYINVFTGEFKK